MMSVVAHQSPRLPVQEDLVVIELTREQIEAINGAGAEPPRAVNPVTHQTYVLLSLEEYRRLTGEGYDDTGWTRDELQAQAWEAGKAIGWDGTDEYDDPPVKS